MKIRLMGEKEELDLMVDTLLKNDQYKIISLSDPYPNRNSIEYRMYIELKVKTE